LYPARLTPPATTAPAAAPPTKAAPRPPRASATEDSTTNCAATANAITSLMVIEYIASLLSLDIDRVPKPRIYSFAYSKGDGELLIQIKLYPISQTRHAPCRQKTFSCKL
jgi:hypothetical protein